MSYTHDHSALRAKVAEQRVDDYVGTWPEYLQHAFWSAVNAPTYSESAEKTLAFATAFAHELAEKLRNYARRGAEVLVFDADAIAWLTHAADHIDPEAPRV